MLVSTDPPYYDNIGYADLSDFFYIWLRRSVGKMYPAICSTLLTPKAQELIAASSRFHGDRAAAAEFFESGLLSFTSNLSRIQCPEYPMTVFYAFKQSEVDDGLRLGIDGVGNHVVEPAEGRAGCGRHMAIEN